MVVQRNPGRGEEPAADEMVPFEGLVRYERHVPINQVSYYLCGELQAPQYYTELFYTLRTAAETDLVYLHINSPGGDFNTGLQIINNMLASEAHVVTVLEARAYSMAAFIFLSGDELIVHDNCQLMFHNYSSSLIGKGNEQHAQVLAIGKWFEKTMSRVCHPFLSHEEIDNILRGEDIWMDSDEIRKRLKRMNKPEKAANLKSERVKSAKAKAQRVKPAE